MHDHMASLPGPLQRNIRTASPDPSIRALLSIMAAPLALEVRLGRERARLPRTARELLKLALVTGEIELRGLHILGSSDTLSLKLHGHARASIEVSEEALERPLQDMLSTWLQELLGERARAELLERMSWSVALHETLRALTTDMLRTQDIADTEHLMLSGITSGHGLGFHRAMLFTYEPISQDFVGARAIGPLDLEEAHRIWESMAYEDITPVHLLDPSHRDRDEPLERFIQQRRLRPEWAGDAITRALESPGAILTRDHALVNTSLQALGLHGAFVLARIGEPERPLGLIVADRFPGAPPVQADALSHFDFFVRQTALVWENLRARQRLEHMAHHDALTGVRNRRAFEARQQALAASEEAWSMVLVDVDHFKQINDTHGHERGDRHLIEIAGILSANLREEDVLGRFGGDEFVIALPSVGPEELRVIIERLGTSALAHGHPLSIGGASFPQDTDAPGDLLANADRNMYRAKRAGRCRGCVRDEIFRFGDP